MQADLSMTLMVSGTSSTLGIYKSQIGNTSTTWETDKIADIGIDVSLFNHFDLTFDWYRKTISGLLFKPTPFAVALMMLTHLM